MYSLGKLFGIDDVEEISKLARIGSGSACRSVYGGFVQWVKGIDSNTSIARQIVDENHWPEMRVLILVVNDKQKDTSSTSGMQLSVKTSSLIRHRVDAIVPKRIDAMIEAIKNRDFNSFAEITMKDSNQFHAITQDTYPPIRYMNDISWSIIRFCHKYNDYYGVNKIAYTFDAGPNACLYLLEDCVTEVISLIKHLYLPSIQSDHIIKGLKIEFTDQLSPKLVEFVENKNIESGSIRYIISTKIGCGPQIISNQNLLNESGFPLKLNKD
jgi:diphosphomevalonate decarboxylase